MYDEKPMHFLMEIQVMCTNILSFIMFYFIVLQCSLIKYTYDIVVD
jgi:hypothetical protein